MVLLSILSGQDKKLIRLFDFFLFIFFFFFFLEFVRRPVKSINDHFAKRISSFFYFRVLYEYRKVNCWLKIKKEQVINLSARKNNKKKQMVITEG